MADGCRHHDIGSHDRRDTEAKMQEIKKKKKLTPATDPSQASRKRKPGQDASHFKTDKSGKLIIDEPSTTSNTTTETSGDRGDAYLANQMAVGGAVRDAKGTLKFNKNTKRGREVEKEYEDTYSGGVLEKEEIIKKKKKEVTKLGEEFRSKVSFLLHPYISIILARLFPSSFPVLVRDLINQLELTMSNPLLPLVSITADNLAWERRYQEKQWSRSIFLRPHRPSCKGKEGSTKSNVYD